MLTAHRKLMKDGKERQQQYVLTLADRATEYEFFKLLVLCVIMEQPRFFISKLVNKDPREMYLRAKGCTQFSP